MEGAMYEQFPRHGKMVSLPHPFVFGLAPANAADKSVSLIFYDNAGEHFNLRTAVQREGFAQDFEADAVCAFPTRTLWCVERKA
jgi:hypothetical protein